MNLFNRMNMVFYLLSDKHTSSAALRVRMFQTVNQATKNFSSVRLSEEDITKLKEIASDGMQGLVNHLDAVNEIGHRVVANETDQTITDLIYDSRWELALLSEDEYFEITAELAVQLREFDTFKRAHTSTLMFEVMEKVVKENTGNSAMPLGKPSMLTNITGEA